MLQEGVCVLNKGEIEQRPQIANLTSFHEKAMNYLV